VARLDPQRFAVTVFHEGLVDSPIAIRPSTRLSHWRKNGNTLQVSLHLLKKVPDTYFFPREGPLDAAVLTFRRRFRLKTAVVSYAIKSLATKLGCTSVDFLGHLSQPQLGQEMRRADIFFFLSIPEGHPQVLLQAAGSGLPIVAMRIYRPDWVVDRTTGFLVDTDDELSTKLQELLTNPDTRRMMRDAAVVHAQKFDREQIAEKWQKEF
jgi:glycosyltransferase involved in cell wall biosynthesis